MVCLFGLLGTNGARHFGGYPCLLFRTNPFWLIPEVLVEKTRDTGTATDLGRRRRNVHNGTTKLLNAGVAPLLHLWMMGLRLHEPLETLLLSLSRPRGTGSAKSKLTVEVLTEEGRRTKTVRRHLYEWVAPGVYKSILEMEPLLKQLHVFLEGRGRPP